MLQFIVGMKRNRCELRGWTLKCVLIVFLSISVKLRTTKISDKIFYTNRVTLSRKQNKISQEPFKLKSIKEMS